MFRDGAVYCVTTPAQLCIFSHQPGFPSSPQSKKAKNCSRKLNTPRLLPVVCSFGLEGASQNGSRRFGDERHADVAGRLSAAVAAATPYLAA